MVSTKLSSKSKSKTKTGTKSKLSSSKTGTKTKTKTKTSSKHFNKSLDKVSNKVLLNNTSKHDDHTTIPNISEDKTKTIVLDDQSDISVHFTVGRFYSKTKTARRVKRASLVKDKFIEYLDDYSNQLLKYNKPINAKTVLQYINSSSNTNYFDDCIEDIILDTHKPNARKHSSVHRTHSTHSEHINKTELDTPNTLNDKVMEDTIEKECECYVLKDITPRVKLLDEEKFKWLYSLKTKWFNIAKYIPKEKQYDVKQYLLDCFNGEYYQVNLLKLYSQITPKQFVFNMYLQTQNYIYLETPRYLLDVIINSYMYNYLPSNVVKVLAFEHVLSNKNNYVLLEDSDYQNGKIFLDNLIKGKLDDILHLENSDDRYKAVTNFLLQCIMVLGHLNTSEFEFTHGNYLSSNIKIRLSRNENDMGSKTKTQTQTKSSPKRWLTFKIDGKTVKLRDMGFQVLISNFENASISISSERYNKQYKLIKPLQHKLFLDRIVKQYITKYSDIKPNKKRQIQINKLFVSNLVHKTLDPTIEVLRIAGIKYYNNIDIYVLFMDLLNDQTVREYFKAKKIDKTVMSFMSDNFIDALFMTEIKDRNIEEMLYEIVDITSTKLHEPINYIFSKEYMKTLDLLNHKLFRDY